MTIEEFEVILKSIAESQKSINESQKSINESQSQADKEIATLLKSQNRYETMLHRHDELIHLLLDKQLKNEELFSELAAWQASHQGKFDRLEAVCEMLGDYTNNTKRDMDKVFAQTDLRLAELSDLTNKTRKDIDEVFAETDRRLAALADFQVRTETSLKALYQAQTRTEDKLGKLSEAQARTEASLVKLSEAQTRTDEQIRRFLSKNGS